MTGKWAHLRTIALQGQGVDEKPLLPKVVARTKGAQPCCAGPPATAVKTCAGNALARPETSQHEKEEQWSKLASRRHQGRDRRARSGLLPRLRQSARLSRLDGALSERRGFCRAPRALPIWPARHADHRGAGIRAGRTRRTALRRRDALAVGARRDLLGAARGGAFRRPYPGHRQRLSASPRPISIR